MSLRMGVVPGRSTWSLDCMRRALCIAAVLALCSPVVSYTRSIAYGIEVITDRAQEAEIEISLYRSPFGRQRPPERFSDDLLHSRKRVVVPPKREKLYVYLNGAEDAYWVRWCELRPEPRNDCEVLYYPLASSVIRLR